MSAKRDYVAEIEEIRERTGPPDWDNGITKLLFLCDQAKRLEKEGEELGYFPVAIVAALETYFRWEIKNLIESREDRYINNLRLDELPLKITHDLVVAVQGKRITIGELVAHAVRLSNLEAISSTMNQLLATDFLTLVKEAREPELRREQGEKALVIIRSPNETFERVNRTFELRHVICHEAHLESPVRLNEIKELCFSCYEFALASRYAIAFHANPGAPQTLQEAYDAARERVGALDDEIRAIEKRILSKINPDMQRAFAAMQDVWRSYVEREAGFDASHHMNGNRGALYEQLTIENLNRERRNKLNEYAARLEG